MDYNAETKLRIFLNHEFKAEVAELLEGCFATDTDPEVSWQLFREQLRKLKKQHCNLYEEYMESDAPDDELTEWQKLKETRA
jgi:hypothetical protein